MINQRRRVAIVFPANAKDRPSTNVHQSRFAGVAKALCAAGIEVVGVPFADDLAEKIRAELLDVDGVLVWVNPIQSGRDRTVLNALLADVSSKGVFVSAHSEVIAKMGTKEVLYRTAKMSWGSDTRLYKVGGHASAVADKPAIRRSSCPETATRPKWRRRLESRIGGLAKPIAIVDFLKLGFADPGGQTRQRRRENVLWSFPLKMPTLFRGWRG